jgi:hypothetical protein
MVFERANSNPSRQQQRRHSLQSTSKQQRNKLFHHASSDLISAEVLQHVVLPKKRRSSRPQQETKKKDRVDLLGDHMTMILNNSNSGFHFDSRTRRTTTTTINEPSTSSNDTTGFTLVPLLCTRNLLVLKGNFQRIRTAEPVTLVLSMIGFCYETLPNRQTALVTVSRSLLLFLCLTLAGLTMVIVACHMALAWAAKEVFLLMIQVFTVLVDWKDLEKHYGHPRVTQAFHCLCAIGRWIDQYMFLRKRFTGREWNDDEFEFDDPLGAQSRHTQLWNLPPPCMKQTDYLCLDHRYLAREEWSQSTSKHVCAINFCYLMMREDFDRKRARRSTVFHQRSYGASPLDGALDAVSESISHEDSEEGESKECQRETTASRRSYQLSQANVNVMGLTTACSPSGLGIELIRNNDHAFNDGDLTTAVLSLSDNNNNNNNNMIAGTPTNIKSLDSPSSRSSVESCSSAAVANMNWVDISARIGMRVLNSTHLQRVVASQEAAERLKNIRDTFVASPRDIRQGKTTPSFDFGSPGDIQSFISLAGMKRTAVNNDPQSIHRTPARPVHSMWTSAAAAGDISDEELSVTSLTEEHDREATSSAAPSAPPSIIRARHFPYERSASSDSMSLAQDGERPKQRLKSSVTIADTEGLGTEVVRRHSSTPLEGSNSYDFEQVPSTVDDVTDTRAWTYLHPQRQPLVPGVKVAAPLFPLQPGGRKVGQSNYQMATVVSSKRIFVDTSNSDSTGPTNCLSVTCKIDRAFLRNGEFAEVTFRVLDEWSSRYFPKHSKVPIGACVSTTFGVGVVVGWRVEDDCHVIRSLWQRKGSGAAHAYLNRDAIKGVLEAAVGFDVMTKCGSGEVLGYVDAGRNFLNGRYIVTLKDDGIYKNCVVALNRDDVYACNGAQFRPVIEHIKEACDYEIMNINYMLQQQLYDGENSASQVWKSWSENSEILWKSFLKAVDEDDEFDEGVEKIMSSIIEFLERLDRPSDSKDPSGSDDDCSDSISTWMADKDDTSFATYSGLGSATSDSHDNKDPSFWLLNDMLGGILPIPHNINATTDKATPLKPMESLSPHAQDSADNSASYKQAFAVVRVLMKTVSLAGAASIGKPQFRLAMTHCKEFLLFVRTLIKVQQKNVSPQSHQIWQSSLEEIKSTFIPIKERLEKIGRGIAQRMEQQGRKAKIRIMRFADSILADDVFLRALCQGEWEQCLLRIEDSMVKANITDADSCVHYRKTVRFIYEHLVRLSSNENGAAERNHEKLAQLAKLVQLIASPKRSLLKLLRKDDVLEFLERILVRVYCREDSASRMLTIHASNFKSLRHLRLLKDLSVSGRLWIPLLDAADEEFSYVVSKMPENAKEVMCPFSSIFSLCVAQFHKISSGHSTKDWLDFMLEDDGVRIIHDIDMKLILALSSFSRDVKDMMVVLPYYPR